MKSNLLLVFVTILQLQLVAQISIPYSHSKKGDIILKQYHTFFNDEYGGITIFLDDEYSNFEKGILKLKSEAVPQKAYIKFNTHKINARLSVDSPATKIKVTELEYFTTKVDSFFVVNTIKSKDKLIDKPSIVQHIVTIEDEVFALYYDMTFNGVVKKKYFIKKNKTDNTWDKIDLKNDPKRKFITGYVAHEKYINKKELSIEDFLNTLKIEKYTKHSIANTAVFFDKQWREVDSLDKAYYYAEVSKGENDLFLLKVFNLSNNIKQFEFSLSSLNPFKKSGKMLVFDALGSIHSERFYDDDKLKSYKIFDNDTLIVAAKKQYDTENDQLSSTTYDKINTNDISLLTTDRFIWKADSLTTLEFSSKFKQLDKVKLVGKETPEVYYNTFNDVQDPKNGNIERALEIYFKQKNNFTTERFNSDLEGTVLLQIDTDYKGRVINYKILNSLNSIVDQWVESFCKSRMTKDSFSKIKFKGIKLDDKQAICRFILPINFQHRQFYKTFSRPNYNFHHFMFQQQWQMQWQQQQFMRAPSFPF